MTTQAIVKVAADFQEDFSKLGAELNDFALRALKMQTELHHKSNYTVDPWQDESYVVENSKTERQFHVRQLDSIFSCSCLFHGSYGLPCRHIFAVRKFLGRPMLVVEDCLERWKRKNPRDELVNKGPLEHLKDVVNADEDDLEDSLDNLHRHKRWTCARNISKAIENKLAELPPQRFSKFLSLFEKFRDEFITQMEDECEDETHQPDLSEKESSVRLHFL